MRRVLLLVSLGLSLACKSSDPAPTQVANTRAGASEVEAEPGKPEPGELEPGVTAELANETKSCQRTLCIAGPGEPSSEANVDLGDLCRKAPSVLRRCEGEVCKSTWAADDWQAGLDGLITSLDLDASGKVDGEDPRCTINLIGWSTGAAIAAGPLVEALTSDSRMIPERAEVERMVLVAPWRAGGGPTLAIPSAVRNAWIYRNTLAPADDCSTAWESGPWISPAPSCGPETNCWDYDYSLEPALAFVSRRGARSGAAIGHCNIMAVVAKIALDNIAHGREAKAEHTPRRSDGRPGGRPHDPPRSHD